MKEYKIPFVIGGLYGDGDPDYIMVGGTGRLGPRYELISINFCGGYCGKKTKDEMREKIQSFEYFGKGKIVKDE